MKQITRNADRIIQILSDRIRTLELEKAYLLDDVLVLTEKLKEVEQYANDDPNTNIQNSSR